MLLRQGLTFGVTIVLARLVTPAEFGTIGLLALFAGIASAFVDSGFSSALIQRQDVTHTDESTVFWFNLLAGVVVALLLWLSGPWIAGFYELPVLEVLVSLLAVNVLISALGAIHATLLTKHLNFKVQMKISGLATGIAGIVAILLAIQGYGIWALAAQIIITTLLTTALLWVFHSWRPAFVFSVVSVRKLFGFGGYLMLAGLLDVMYTRLYSLIIGKVYSVAELGHFNRADGVRQMPLGLMGSVISRVAFPVFSMAAGEPDKLRQGVRFSIRVIMFINIPVMMGISAVAAPLVEALFGAAWVPAAPLLSVLALASIFWPLHVINLQVLKAQGHSALFFRLELIKKVVGTLFLVAGSLYGVIGMVYGILASGLASFYINAYYTRVFLQYGAWQQTKDFLPVLAITAPMAVLVGWMGHVWNATAWVELPVLSLLGAAIFLVLVYLARLPHLSELLGALKKRKPAVAGTQ